MSQKTLNYGLIRDLDTLKRLVDKLGEDDRPLGYDIETGYYGPDREKGALFPAGGSITAGFSITNDPAWARYVPLAHDTDDCLDPEVVWPMMKPLLEQKRVVCHHAKFEAKFARQVDIKLGVKADTMLDAYVLSEHQGFGLKDLVLGVFGHQMVHIQELFPGATAAQLRALRFNVLSLSTEVVTYACEDAAWTLALYQKLDARAQKERPFMYRLEHGISEMMAEVELWGTDVDWEGLQRDRATAEPFLARWEKHVKAELGAMAGRSVATMNLNSTKQLKELLYGELGLSTTRKTKTGADSTDAVALETLSKKFPAIKALLELREIDNLRKRFVKWLEEKPGEVPIKGRDGRVHANYNQVVVGTGRFAANDPPIQQLPKEWGWELPDGTAWRGNYRDFIRAGEGCYFLGYDYSQIELRVMAGLSQEPALLKAFNEDADVHTLTAAMMLRKPVHMVDRKTERQIGKAQPLDAKILTPRGWTTMGELKVGDEVVGSDGRPTRVTGVFPQGVRDVYKVVTSDGAVAECCEEHLWTVRNKNSGRDAPWRTRSLRYLMDHGVRQTAGKHDPKYELPPRPVVQFDPRPEPKVDPYVMGLLLGDGDFTHSWGPSFSSEDPELLVAAAQEHEKLGGVVAGHFLRRDKAGVPNHPGFYLSGDNFRRGTNVVKDVLRSYGLWEVPAHEKWVPEDYMLGSPETRLAVLQGLLDTDGNVVMGTSAQFRVTSERLALCAQELARSLGGFASIKEFQPEVGAGYGATRRVMWNVHLSLPNGMSPFRLKRKADQIRERRRSISQHIFRVEGGDAREVQCVSVASEDGLYVSSAYVVTHNTMNFA